MYKKFEIKNPCHQKWEEMTELEHGGKHCSQCNHVIHDFSKMNNAELLEMLQSGKYSCGKFSGEQMGILYQINNEKNNRKKYWSSIAAAIVGGFLQLSTGYSQTHAPVIKKQHVVGTQTNRPIDGTNTDPDKREQEELSPLKVDFKIIDFATKQPIKNAMFEIAGTVLFSDANGKIVFQVPRKIDLNKEYNLKVTSAGYKIDSKTIRLIDCVGTTIIYLFKEDKNNKEYEILGRWG